ncbi:DNA-directed RNA polymerase specialized sigma24 family protein [Streptomyces phaeochromogenes]|jgi:DNA-directed RNA polymerase specialized sigma24 family protein|uniref:hypothetical protein n=1 Tax=Streptomyces phaeochromogenes TaxID=1923 RepID=UPI00279250EF|nr:hypothetical protein [Streptomyces phaeochromogenes]MDQ0947670.1 DNA-directed RNA polymerase specialized sigma24 family protein [Streptomyces phaeochromogenes]
MSESPAPETDKALNTATPLSIHHRELSFAIDYNMLGGVADTEDVPQDTWLSWSGIRGRSPLRKIDNPHAYLVRTALNHASKRRAVISRRRVTYSVSTAMPVVPESPSPRERAVFVPGEVFGHAHTGIAEVVDRSPAAVRRHVHARRPQDEKEETA